MTSKLQPSHREPIRPVRNAEVPAPLSAVATSTPPTVAAARRDDAFAAASPRASVAPVGVKKAPDDLKLAFPSFGATVAGHRGRVVPIDITKSEVEFSLDAQHTGLVASSTVTFRQAEAGMPMLNMLPTPTKVAVDGQAFEAASFARVNVGPGTMTGPTLLDEASYEALPLADKDGFQPGRVVAKDLPVGKHTLTTSYALTAESLRHDDRDESLKVGPQGVDLFLRMSDLVKTLPGGQARASSFAGAYLPSNFQFDRVPLTVKFSLPAAPPEQRVFSNGVVKAVPGPGQKFEVTFPPGFNTSEVYLHVVPAASVVEKTVPFKSIDGRSIGITAYVARSSVGTKREGEALLNAGEKTIAKTLSEMEGLFGPFPHDQFVAQLWPSSLPQDGGTGMEYAGATESTLAALRHETIHSYFGRSLAPANGNAAWIDEAVTSWLEDGRQTSETKSSWAHDLSVATPYEQDTNRAAYNAGQNLLRDLDLDLRGTHAAGTGILTALQKVFVAFHGKQITNDDFVATVLSTAATPAQAAAAKATFARYGLGLTPLS